MQRLRLTPTTTPLILKQTIDVLNKNGLIVYPTDTVYGLGVNAKSVTAVKKLLEFKERPRGRAISIALPSLASLNTYVKVKNNVSLLETLLPGPFTVVLTSQHNTDLNLEAEDGTIGVRIMDHPFIQKLTGQIQFPLTATSANITGRGPHYSVDALLNTLSEKKKQMIDLIIDAGELPHNLPSTVINLAGDSMTTLREGDLNPRIIQEARTANEHETKLLAEQLMRTYQDSLKTKPLIIILKGDLGSGKTVFTKGVGTTLNITRIVSPTFVIYYEYEAKHPTVDKLHHFDLYRLETNEDLEILQIPKLLKPRNVLIFEWGDKIRSIKKLLGKNQAIILLVRFEEVDENTRSIQVLELS